MKTYWIDDGTARKYFNVDEGMVLNTKEPMTERDLLVFLRTAENFGYKTGKL